MRLFEGEVRTVSMTGSEAASSRKMQASNFSFFSRSAASFPMGTVSTPNWRKHSEMICWAGPWIHTSAARAELFLLISGIGAGATPRDFSMMSGGGAVKNLFWPLDSRLAKANKANPTVQKSHYRG